MTTLQWGAATHVGQLREANQDRYLVLDGLFAVADGMGGHRGGEVASSQAVDTLRDTMTSPSADALVQAVVAANLAVFGRGLQEPELQGMGTTLVVLALLDRGGASVLGVANVGDSRAYLLADGGLSQLTEDHSLVETMVRQGQLTQAEAENHPRRNILTRALGIEPELEVDLWEVRPASGDRFLLCSDGLFNELSDDQITGTLRRLANPQEAADELVRLANEHGGRDNITVVLVDVVDGAGEPPGVVGTRISRLDGFGAGPAAAGGHGPRADDHTALIPLLDGASAPGGGGGAQAAVAAGEPGGGADPAGRRGKRGRSGRGSATVERPLRPRRFTWRVGAFLVIIVLLLGVAAGALGWYARNTWYVGFDDDVVTVFRGQHGGLLWFEPTVEQHTELTRAALREADANRLDAGVDRSSLEDALAYVDNIRDQAPPTTTTTVPVDPAATTTLPVDPGGTTMPLDPTATTLPADPAATTTTATG